MAHFGAVDVNVDYSYPDIPLSSADTGADNDVYELTELEGKRFSTGYSLRCRPLPIGWAYFIERDCLICHLSHCARKPGDG